MNLAIIMKVAKFVLQPSFPYFTRLFAPKKGRVARLQWYLKIVFTGQNFDRSRRKKRDEKYAYLHIHIKRKIRLG